MTHTVLVGYGIVGRAVVRALLAEGQGARSMALVQDFTSLVLAMQDGIRAVLGDGDNVVTLRAADVHEAQLVIITVGDDPVAMRATHAARWLNPAATVVTAVEQPEWTPVARRLGADRVMPTCDMLARATRVTGGVQPGSWTELALVERDVTADEAGTKKVDFSPLVLAVLRDGIRMWCESPELEGLREGDRVLVLTALLGRRMPSC